MKAKTLLFSASLSFFIYQISCHVTGGSTMAAFDRVCSGISQMDTAFDNIRLGDNVVWRVDDLDEFKLFVMPYVKQAIADKRNLIYIRFASQEPLLEEQEGLKIVNVE